MSSAEITVIGTTGSNPRTVVPEAIRVTISVPATESTPIPTPGGGAGTTHCRTATPPTAAAVQTVVASAPHFVLFFQKSAAISKRRQSGVAGERVLAREIEDRLRRTERDQVREHGQHNDEDPAGLHLDGLPESR